MNDQQQLQETTAFLSTVLPARRDGEVYRVEVLPPPPFRANNFVNVEKMAEHLLRFGRKPYNAYFALATFPSRGKDRLAEHALRFGDVWADLDCGPGKKFATPDEAVAHLATFPLAPTAIVASGRGIHSHWPLREAVEDDGIDRLLAIVRRIAHDWGGDPATVMRSQILRVPGTMNIDSVQHKKDGLDYPVRLLQFEPERRYALSEFIEAGIEPLERTERKPPIGPNLPDGQRHRSLVTEAARLRNLGYDADEIDAALQVVNAKRGANGGVPEEEVRSIAEWAGRLRPGAIKASPFAFAKTRGPIHVA